MRHEHEVTKGGSGKRSAKGWRETAKGRYQLVGNQGEGVGLSERWCKSVLGSCTSRPECQHKRIIITLRPCKSDANDDEITLPTEMHGMGGWP